MKVITTQELEHTARTTLKQMGLPNANIKVSWADEGMHYTDGSTFIVVNRSWYGKDLSRRTKWNKKILTGVIQHEIIHWVQDLPEIDAAAQSAGLPHFFNNIICDIQGEKMLINMLSKGSCKPLFAARRLIRKNKIKSFFDGITGDPDLADADAIALFGRFKMTPRPFSHGKKNAKCNRGLQFSAYLKKKTPDNAADLPAFMYKLAEDFPELVQQGQSGSQGTIQLDPGDLTPVILAGCGFTKDEIGQLQSTCYARCKTHAIPKQRGPILPGAMQLGAKIRMHLNREHTVKVIEEVGTINRRKLVYGAIIPFDYTVSVEKSLGRSVIMAVDLSGSMLSSENRALAQSTNGAVSRVAITPKDPDSDTYASYKKLNYEPDNRSKALTVAQATVIAVTSEGGQVIGVLFGDYALVSSGSDKAAILFPEHGHEIGLGGTSFLWLKLLWNTYPDHQVIIVTDGEGMVPSYITAQEKARTTVISIVGGDADPRMHQISDNVIVLPDITELPKYVLGAIN